MRYFNSGVIHSTSSKFGMQKQSSTSSIPQGPSQTHPVSLSPPYTPTIGGAFIPASSFPPSCTPGMGCPGAPIVANIGAAGVMSYSSLSPVASATGGFGPAVLFSPSIVGQPSVVMMGPQEFHVILDPWLAIGNISCIVTIFCMWLYITNIECAISHIFSI